MDLEPGVFTMTPKRMAKSMRRSVEGSDNLKSSPFRSGMSMLSFYQNRAGKRLPEERRQAIQQAKHEFRKLYKMADLGTVEEWLEKTAIPKGSPYTKRFGQKYTNKMTSPVGKVPNRSFRGKYTKLAIDNPLGNFSSEDLYRLLGDKQGIINETIEDIDFLNRAAPKNGDRSWWDGKIQKLYEEVNRHKKDHTQLNSEYSSRLPYIDSKIDYSTPGPKPAPGLGAYLPSSRALSFGAGVPGVLGAAAGAYESPDGRLYGAARGGLTAGLGGGIGTAIGHGLGTLAGHPTLGTIAGSAIGGLGGYALGRPSPVHRTIQEDKLASLGSVTSWLQKKAVGTGDEDYESPSSGSYGNHKHVEGENECHLCKGQPIIEVERSEREAEKQAEGHDSVEYHEILKIVAEAHGVDLTKPESIDLLPALLREADHVMMKHEKLETAEEEMGEQMMGKNEQSQ